jgi:hypothetical protein
VFNPTTGELAAKVALASAAEMAAAVAEPNGNTLSRIISCKRKRRGTCF